MEEGLNKILKELKAIKPDEGFVQRSRHLILSSPQEKRGLFNFKLNLFEGVKLATAITLASAMLFVFFGGLSYFNVKNLSPVTLSSLNADNLKAEAEKLDFQIQLGQANYNLGSESDKEIGAKIDEILKDLSL